MERIFPLFIAMFLGFNCEQITLPLMFDEPLYTLISNFRLGGYEADTALEVLTKANRWIKELNKAYPNISAEVEKLGKDPEKLLEKAFIDLKNTIAHGRTEITNETSLITYGVDVYNKTQAFDAVLDKVDGDGRLLPIWLMGELAAFTTYCVSQSIINKSYDGKNCNPVA